MKAYPPDSTINPSNSDEEDDSKYNALLQHLLNSLDMDDGADNDDDENDIDPPRYYDVPRPQKRPGYSKPGEPKQIFTSKLDQIYYRVACKMPVEAHSTPKPQTSPKI